MTKISDERLAEMLAGLEGVTPGPWEHQFEVDGLPYKTRVKASRKALATTAPQCGRPHNRDEMAANAAHIARCDPDTIRSLITELQKLRAHNSDRADPVAPSDYDAGLISDYGGGNVDWWMDYIRTEIERANDFWRAQVEAIASPPANEFDTNLINEVIDFLGGVDGAVELRGKLLALTNRTPDDEVGNG